MIRVLEVSPGNCHPLVLVLVLVLVLLLLLLLLLCCCVVVVIVIAVGDVVVDVVAGPLTLNPTFG